jgi:4-hydroxybenzoate polyprenyltransferase
MKRWHAWLELARISNLPTVWTNVLAGWLLAGGVWRWGPLAWLLLGGSLMYTAGMILNDAFDAKFDREHRKERPIPSGRITVGLAWGVGVGMLITGAVICYFGARACGWLVLALAGAIVAYDAFHKPWAGSVLIMGSCRTLLYLVAGSAVADGLDVHEDFLLIVKAIALGGYVVGLSLVARSEATARQSGFVARWLGRLFLSLPVLVGLAVADISRLMRHFPNTATSSSWIGIGDFRLGSSDDFHAFWLQFALIVSLIGLLVYAVRLMRTPPPSNIGRAVGLLLAGIVVVDALAVSPMAPIASVIFAASMPLLLLWQRKIAAT